MTDTDTHFEYNFSFTVEEIIELTDLLNKTVAVTDPQAPKYPIYKRINQEIEGKALKHFLDELGK